MKLLFTLIPKVILPNKSFLLLKYDTDKQEGNLVDFDLNIKFLSTSGIVYSGKYLCIGVQVEKEKDKIIIYDIYNQYFKVFNCSYSKNIGNIISIYPGKLYLDSQQTNAIVKADFDAINLSFFKDTYYYIVNENVNLGIKSLYNYNNIWYLATQKNKKIINLSHDCVVYSDIDIPTCIFFNSNQRICFIEYGKNLFHCGDDIFEVGENPTSAIEDINKGGYWIVCDTDLYFIDYEGEIKDILDLSKWGYGYNNIVEAKGLLAE